MRLNRWRSKDTINVFSSTSPSVYVGFSSLYAVDRCGAVGTFINYTMLAFTPGELSTIEVPAWQRASIPLSATKSFNFADLPCPPQSVMVRLLAYQKNECLYLISSQQIADQYKPSPGSPYRPVLSPPAQLYSLQSGWSNCVITHAFAGIDPPRALIPAAALVPHQTPASPQSQTTTADPEKIASRSPEASVTAATRDPPPAPAHKYPVAGPASTTSSSAPSAAVNDPPTSKTYLDPQKAQHSEDESKMQVSSEKAKDSSIQDSFKDASFISTSKSETSREPLDAVQPSKILSDHKSDQKDTLSPNPVTSDPLPTSEEHDEDGVTRPLTRTVQTPSSKDEPGRAAASFNPDRAPGPDNLRQESKHPQGTSTAEAGSLRVDSYSIDDISTADSKPQDSTNGNPNGSPDRIINNSPTDLAAEANAAEDPGLGSGTASSSLNPHYDATPASASTPLHQPPAPEAPPTSIPSHSNPATPQIDPLASKPASMKDVDPSPSGQGPLSLIEYQSQSPPPAPGHEQTASTAQAVQAQAQAAFQQYENYKNTNANTDPNINMSSTASGRRGVGGAVQPSSSSPSRGGGNSDGNAVSVLPFQNGGEGKRIGVLVWIVGLGGCVGAMFPLYFI